MRLQTAKTMLLAALLVGLCAVSASAQHENDMHFGVADGKMTVKAPTTCEVPKIMYYNDSYWVRDQGTDGVLVSGSPSYYELKSETWQQISYTPGLVYGGWFGQDWLSNPPKPGFVNLDDGSNRHTHKNVMAGFAGTYLLKLYLKNGVDHYGNHVQDSDPWTMIWVTCDPNNLEAPAYAQVDLPLLRNLPDTPPNPTDSGFAGVDVSSLVASGIFPSGFYAQTENQTGGVFVRTTQAVSLGDRVRVKGNLSTNGSERIFTATEAISATPGLAPKPLGVTTRLIGGGPAGKYTPGTKGGVGLSTTGLLVRVGGVIRYSGTSSYISDGCTMPSGLPGVRISQDLLGAPLTLPTDGNPLAISGISGTEVVGVDVLPLIRPRGQADVTSY